MIALLGKKGSEIVWEWIIKILIFAITFLIALQLCSNYSKIFDKTDARDAEIAFSTVYQAVMHLDPDFDELADQVKIKTRDFEIRGYSDQAHCDRGSCICLCSEGGCKECRDIPYQAANDFIIGKSQEYKIYYLQLVPIGEGYELRLENG